LLSAIAADGAVAFWLQPARIDFEQIEGAALERRRLRQLLEAGLSPRRRTRFLVSVESAVSRSGKL